MSDLKNELKGLKETVENIESNLNEKVDELEKREERWRKLDETANDVKEYQNDIIRLNVSGKKFATRRSTLLNIKDTLFYKMVLCNKFDFSQEIFIDRSNNLFSFIIDYLRYNKINYRRFNSEELEELKIEADYYELVEISSYLEERLKEPALVAFEFSGPYIYNGVTSGGNNLEDIKERNLSKGICATTPGWIIFELNFEFTISEIELGGYNGNTSLWGAENGAGASILVSKDKVNWTNVGTIPSGYGTNIVTVQLTPNVGKFIKFNHNSYLGIGYLKINKK